MDRVLLVIVIVLVIRFSIPAVSARGYNGVPVVATDVPIRPSYLCDFVDQFSSARSGSNVLTTETQRHEGRSKVGFCHSVRSTVTMEGLYPVFIRAIRG